MQAIVERCAARAGRRGRRRGQQPADAAGWLRGRRAASHRGGRPQGLRTREAFDAELARVIDLGARTRGAGGFMRILVAAFVRRYEGRMLNVHPSLLPAFTGLHTHRRAIEAGCKLAGATVHFVTPELDHGPIVAQAACRCCRTTTRSAVARVLAREHGCIRCAVRWFVAGAARRSDGIVTQLDGESQWLRD
jgi:phosphoribosylglycinamide formyltransferase-1